MKVLYADDDIQVRDYVSMLLEAGLDCEILEASSGNEALSILEFDSEVDFVITEVRMKGGNGNVIVDFLDHHKLNIPIVWLSDPVNKDIMLVQEILARSPLNAFVGKPFRDDQFFPVIDRILNLQAEHSETETIEQDKNKNENENENKNEDVEFEDSDFDFADEWETKSTEAENKDDDWNYGFSSKKKAEEIELDYGRKKKKSEQEEAGYSLKNEFSSREEEAGYSLKNEFSSSEEEAGYSLKNELSSGEDAVLDYSKESKEKSSKSKIKKTNIETDKSNKNLESKDDKDDKDDYDKTRFKRVKLKRFLNFNVICCDVYLKMNQKKYLRVINSSEEYAQDMIAKYSEKGIIYLFVENEQYPHFSEQFGNLVMERLEKAKSLSGDIRSVAELAAFENTMESALELGVTPVVAQKVRQAIKANIDSLGKMPKLDALLARIMRGGDYLSEHSLLLSYVAGQICMATSWGNAQTLEKLAMAAMFHDIALEKNQWGRFHNLEQAKNAGLSEHEIQQIKDHPGLAAKLVSEGEHIFADVDAIIIQHHELPDQSGFPRGLGALSISPLSCIFIIASEFVEEVYGKAPSSIDINNIKAKFSDTFNRGNFKKPLAAFLKVF